MLPPASHSHPTPSPGCPIPILSRVTPSSSHPDPSLLWSHTSLSPCFLGSILLCPHPAPPCPQPNLVLPHAVPSYLGSTLPQPHPTPFPCHPIPISPCPHPSLIPSFSIPVPFHPYSTLSLSYLGFIPFQPYQNSSISYLDSLLPSPHPTLVPFYPILLLPHAHHTLAPSHSTYTPPHPHPCPHPMPFPFGIPIPSHSPLQSPSQAILPIEIQMLGSLVGALQAHRGAGWVQGQTLPPPSPGLWMGDHKLDLGKTPKKPSKQGEHNRERSQLRVPIPASLWPEGCQRRTLQHLLSPGRTHWQ